MAFLTIEDYATVVDSKVLEIITQAGSEERECAERYAVEEIGSYLRAARFQKPAGVTPVREYDTDAAFAAEGGERNPQLVMYACDVALFHLAARLPGRIGFDIRNQRYERAVKWLEGVQAGKILLDIPLIALPSEEEGEEQNPIRWGSLDKSVYDW
jgi:phage gp36-like protein